MSANVHQKIDETVKNSPVVLYMKGSRMMPQCGFSAATVNALESLGIEFSYVNVLADEEIRQGIKEYSNWPTIPQLFIGGEFVGGSDIVLEMHRKGELAPLVQNAVGAQA